MVLVVGLAPVPRVYLLGLVLVGGFVALAIIDSRSEHRRTRPETAESLPVFTTFVAFGIALMLRGSELSWLLTPVLALVLLVVSFAWARNREAYLKSSADPE